MGARFSPLFVLPVSSLSSDSFVSRSPTRRNAKQYYPLHTSPHPSGTQLLRSGAFGAPPPRSYAVKPKQAKWIDPTNVVEKVRMRELGLRRTDKVGYWGGGVYP